MTDNKNIIPPPDIQSRDNRGDTSTDMPIRRSISPTDHDTTQLKVGSIYYCNKCNELHIHADNVNETDCNLSSRKMLQAMLKEVRGLWAEHKQHRAMLKEGRDVRAEYKQQVMIKEVQEVRAEINEERKQSEEHRKLIEKVKDQSESLRKQLEKIEGQLNQNGEKLNQFRKQLNEHRKQLEKLQPLTQVHHKLVSKVNHLAANYTRRENFDILCNKFKNHERILGVPEAESVSAALPTAVGLSPFLEWNYDLRKQ